MKPVYGNLLWIGRLQGMQPQVACTYNAILIENAHHATAGATKPSVLSTIPISGHHSGLGTYIKWHQTHSALARDLSNFRFSRGLH